MHDLGLIIYYSDDEGLRNIVVLNPEWLTKAISHVLEDDATRKAGGILDHARLRQIWNDHAVGIVSLSPLLPPVDGEVRYLLPDRGDETRSLVAQLVPLQRPALAWQQDASPRRESGH